ncbi:MAG: protease inhibitor I42 family protein [Bacteroidales bacterium]
MKKTLNLGDLFTLEVESNPSTGTNIYIAHLEGGLALVDISTRKGKGLLGSPEQKIFTFLGIEAGEAAVQLVEINAKKEVLYHNILPIEIISAENCGGCWSDYRIPTIEDLTVFKEAVNFIGATYIPLLVSSQIVAGINYSFMCKYLLTTNPVQEGYAMVNIFKPLPKKGKATVTGIIRFLDNPVSKKA